METGSLILSLAAELASLTRRARCPASGVRQTEARILLELLSAAGPTDAEITHRIGSDKAQISRALTRMIASGLVDEAPGEHKQQRRLLLSPQGRSVAADIKQSQAQAVAALAPDLDRQDVAALDQLLLRFRSNKGRSVKEPRYTIKPADTSDLVWLLGEALRRPAGYSSRKSQLQKQAAELADHLNLMIERGETSWIILNWGERVGGCVFTPVKDAEEDAKIHLLVLPMSDTSAVARNLIRACVYKAKEQTFERLYIDVMPDENELEEVLSELGFKPTKRERLYVRDQWRDAVTWSRVLLPPLA